MNPPPAPLPQAAPDRKPFYAAIAVFLIACATFAVSRRNDFTFDDIAALRDNPCYDTGEILPNLFTRDYFRTSTEVTYRPLVTASYAVDHALWTRPLPVGDVDVTPQQYRDLVLHNQQSWNTGLHLTNVLLHALNSVLVFVLVLRLGNLPAALVAALLFAVHPVQAEAVNAAGYREDLLAALFVLAGSIAYLTWRSPWRVAAAAVCYLLGLLSKESAAMMPVGLFVIERLFTARAKPLRSLVPGYLLFALVAVVYLILRFGPLYNPVETRTPYPGGSLWTGLLTALPALIAYVRLLIVPVDLSMDYAVAPCLTPLDWRVWSSAAVLTAAAWATVRLARHRPLAAAGLIWCFVMLLPTCNILPIPNVMADRYLYLPMAGITLASGSAAALLWLNAPRARQLAAAAAFAAVVIGLAALSVNRSLDWRTQETLANATLRTNPRSIRSWINLGNAQLERNELLRAEDCYRHALDIKPDCAPACAQLGQVLDLQGRPTKAEFAYIAALKYDPGNVVALQGLGMVFLRKGQMDVAIESFRKAAAQQNRDGPALADLGTALSLAGRREEAESVLREAVARSPRNAQVWTAWGNYLFRIENYPAAAEAHTTATRLRPGDPRLMMNLGAALTAMGRPEQAIPLLQKALTGAPDLDEARYNLVLCLAQSGRSPEAQRELAELARRNPTMANALRAALSPP